MFTLAAAPVCNRAPNLLAPRASLKEDAFDRLSALSISRTVAVRARPCKAPYVVARREIVERRPPAEVRVAKARIGGL